jgi:hypothetical protein
MPGANSAIAYSLCFIEYISKTTKAQIIASKLKFSAWAEFSI